MLCWDNDKKTQKTKTQSLYTTSKGNICTASKGNCSISKDPIDFATVKLHIIHKTLLFKIPFVNKQKIKGHYPTDEIFLLKQIICHSRYRTDLTLHYL